jgi:hypothetical protein
VTTIRFTRTLLVALAFAALSGCKRPYRVGEHVQVEWEEGSSQYYPAYILERVGATRYRVHFDGYDSRFDEDVSFDRISGRVEGSGTAPPPPPKVVRATGAQIVPDAGAGGGNSSSVAANPYKSGDRLRVRWRGSIYSATVLDAVARDKVLVRYDGYETAWDEVVQLDRIVGRR